MNTVKQIFWSVAFIVLSFTGLAQSNHSGNDTGFVARNIRNHIMSIRVAQLAEERASTPRIKELAREVIRNDREMLQKLLVVADPNNLAGTDEKELDRVIGNFGNDTIHSLRDTAAAATTGNTVTDSLGSGSSGSGNVHGDDTGTIARSHSGRRNANYSEQGEYLYYNTPGLEPLKDIDKQKGKKFNRQWLRFMSDLADARLKDFERESDKNGELRTMVVQAIPRLRSQKEQLALAARGDRKPAQRDRGAETPSNQNTGGGATNQ